MSKSATWLIELPLAALLVFLAALLLLPRPARPLPAPAGAMGEETAGSAGRPPSAPRQRAPAERIAVLFGWERKVVPPPRPQPAPAPAPEAPPAPATWLKSMGWVVGQDGNRLYVFKDSRGGNVLSVPLGGQSRGWKLLEVLASGEFLLEFEGQRYTTR